MSKPNFLFDIGNVLVHFDFTDAIAKIRKDSNNAEEDLMAQIDDLKKELEDGDIDGPAFVKACIERLQYTAGEETFTKAWNEVFSPIDIMWKLIPKIAQDHELYLLSNTSDLHKDYLFDAFSEIFQYFKGGIYSYSAKSQKPKPEIYQQAIDTYGLDPKNTIYVDDLPENIEAGQGLDFISWTYQAKTHESFEAWLKQEQGIALS